MIAVALTLTQSWHRVPGGTATSALGLADALAARPDVQITGIGPRGHNPAPAPFDPSIAMVRLGLPYQALYDVWHHSNRQAPESLLGRCDIVHATTTLVPPTKTAKLVVTVHDMFPYLEPDRLTRRGARILQRGIDLAKQRAAIVCCPSQQTADDCVAAGFDQDKVQVIPWGVETGAGVASNVEVDRVRVKFKLERPYLLWVGTIEPRKNLATLLRAFGQADLDGVDLVMVGPDGWSEDVAPMAKRLGDRVKLLGFVPAADLSAIYAGAQALVLPSHGEGFGLPALEAMAQGTPVVGAAGTAIAEVIADVGLLVEPLDLVGWVSALSVAADDSWRAGISGQALARAQEFTWEQTASLTVAAYHQALA